MAAQQIFFVICLVALLSSSTVTSLRCYQCSSGKSDICDDTFSYNAQQIVRLQECQNSPVLPIPGAILNTHCGKTKSPNSRSPNDYVFRGCVPENYCQLVKASVDECHLCEEDKCNSSSGLFPSTLLGILAFFGILALRFV